MEVDRSEVSLTNYNRTRDSRFRLIYNRSDVPASCSSREFLIHAKRLDLVTTLLEITNARIEYITTNNRR
jgi:hypothetical protein